MKVLSAKVKNFGSYEELNIDFRNQGLTLISGPTGSGKSTLCDVVPWILFGRTAKGGAVDEIRPWNTEEVTSGEITLEINGTNTVVSRTRGPNDLSITTGDMVTRGKDLTDTQKLINTLLGMDLESYLLSSYFNEFSSISLFFTTTAKNRRQITEQIVDLSLAKRIQESAAEYRKGLTEAFQALESEEKSLNRVLDNTILLKARVAQEARNWAAKQIQDLEKAKLSDKHFEANKQARLKEIRAAHVNEYAELQTEKVSLELSLLPTGNIKRATLELNRRKASLKDVICVTCGNHLDNTARVALAKEEADFNLQLQKNEQLHFQLDKLIKKIDSHNDKLAAKLASADSANNSQVEYIESQTNPHLSTSKDLKQKISELKSKLITVTQEIQDTEQELGDIKLLAKVVEDFRSTLISNTLLQIETNTNNLLASHFDAEIKVKFTADEADKIEVEIYKDGNLASFTQLSKGQRQLLKLTFAVSIMSAVSNLRGVTLNTVFFDEALDGLDSELKTKAFSLLQSLALSYESVLVVEHSPDLKLLFTNQLDVTIKNGFSSIE